MTFGMIYPFSTLRCLLLFSFALCVVGCESSFDPIQESTRYFSIFGYLDASADTQFVRVSPLRDTVVIADARPLDAVVTLEHLASGRVTVWKDSVFTYPGGLLAHNFWSVERIEPGETYLFRVERADGNASTVEVTLPDSFPDPTLQIPRFDPLWYLTVLDVERLADLRMIYVVHDELRNTFIEVPVSYLEFASAFTGGFAAVVDPRKDMERVRQALGILSPMISDIKIFAAAGGPGWPQFFKLDDELVALPDAVSNVQQGVGFLGGVMTRKFSPPR